MPSTSPPPCSETANPVESVLGAYERAWLKYHSLDDVLDHARTIAGGDPFVVSGLYDLRASLAMVDDHFRMHVRLEWRELDTRPGTYDPLWGESAGRKAFRRTTVLPTHVKQERRDFKRGATGSTVSQPATMVLPITDLWRSAYLPKAGDQVRYRNLQYEVLAAYADPAHYWQNTGFPLYWTCEMGIAPLDSRFRDASATYEAETGAPALTEPSDPGSPSTTEPD